MRTAPATRQLAAAIVVLIVSGFSVADGRAEGPSLAGAWTVNKELSDQPKDSGAREGGGDHGVDPAGAWAAAAVVMVAGDAAAVLADVAAGTAAAAPRR